MNEKELRKEIRKLRNLKLKMRGGTPERDKIAEENIDAVKIDKYEHTQIYYSVSGEGRNCRWDTSNAWAVWLPTKALLEELKGLTKAKRRKKVLEFARQACEVYNKWVNGEVFGFIAEDTEENNIDSCWGFYEIENAIKRAKEKIDYYVKESKKLPLQY